MKTIPLLCRSAILTLMCALSTLAQTPPGVPEPGLIMYGAVTNSNGGALLQLGNVNWTVSFPGGTASSGAVIVNVNGQFFYTVRIPFETRSAAGQNFTPTAGTLPLFSTATNFTRSATVLNVGASIVAPASSTFSFGAADRGRVERINLTAALNVDPAQDSDHDGVPDFAEQIAGTDPNNPNSVFKLSTDIQPSLSGGLTIKWSSVANKHYSVYRTSDLTQPFTQLAGNLASTPPLNQYTDSTATGLGPYFYRIQVGP